MMKSGLVVDIPLKMYLEMDDDTFEEEIENLYINGYGVDIGDPFYQSACIKTEHHDSIEEIELPDINSIEKLEDLDNF